MALRVMINGQLCSGDAAMVSVFDRGFLYGDSVFETIRTYRGRAFALSEHLSRLQRSAQKVFIDLPVPSQQLALEVNRTLSAAGNDESYVRVMITRGQGALGLDPALADKPSRVIIVDALKAPLDSLYRSGIKTITYKTRRPSDATAAEGAKVGNYLVAVMATREAKLRGAAEALIVDADGGVVEGATSNLFLVSDGQLGTPPESAGILPGITRQRILQAARNLGLPVAFTVPSSEQLGAADEVFISSSIRELMPVVQVDDQLIGSGVPGPVTTRLHREFRREVEAGDETD